PLTSLPFNVLVTELPKAQPDDRGWLGLQLKDLSTVETEGRGTWVTDVIEGSAAAAAGLMRDDIVLSIDDYEITGAKSLVDAVAARRPGTTARLRLIRDGKEKAVLVTVGKRPITAQTIIPSNLARYRDVAWLGARTTITVLPSVASLKALRQFAKTSGATKLYLGIGNPLLDGDQADPRDKKLAQLARDKQQCPKTLGESLALAAAKPVATFAKLFR